MKQTRFQIAKKDIIKLFDSLEKNIFSYSDISEILSNNIDFWRLPQNTSIKKFIYLLQENTFLKSLKFQFPSFNKSLYIWRDGSLNKTLLSIKPNSYFSHYSAMFIHNLTDQIPKTYYLNIEQSPKPRSPNNAILSQEKVDMAFLGSQRLSNNICKMNNYRVCILNGKNHNNLGVISINFDNELISITDIERTLIDIAVRPEYAGGIYEVLKAYRNVKGKVSLNRIQAYLKQMDFVYPYNQSIGFYLSKSGVYSNQQLSLLKKNPFKINFYIGHKLSNLKFDKEWNIYYPGNIDL